MLEIPAFCVITATRFFCLLDFKSFLSLFVKYPSSYLGCRAILHSWRELIALRLETPGWVTPHLVS